MLDTVALSMELFSGHSKYTVSVDAEMFELLFSRISQAFSLSCRSSYSMDLPTSLGPLWLILNVNGSRSAKNKNSWQVLQHVNMC